MIESRIPVWAILKKQKSVSILSNFTFYWIIQLDDTRIIIQFFQNLPKLFKKVIYFSFWYAYLIAGTDKTCALHIIYGLLVLKIAENPPSAICSFRVYYFLCIFMIWPLNFISGKIFECRVKCYILLFR